MEARAAARVGQCWCRCHSLSLHTLRAYAQIAEPEHPEWIVNIEYDAAHKFAATVGALVSFSARITGQGGDYTKPALTFVPSEGDVESGTCRVPCAKRVRGRYAAWAACQRRVQGLGVAAVRSGPQPRLGRQMRARLAVRRRWRRSL